MLEAESQAPCMSSAISLAENSNIFEPLAPQRRRVGVVAVDKLSQVELRNDAWHSEPRFRGKLASMKLTSTQTFSAAMIRKGEVRQLPQ
jgi:hypothetical protein